MTIYERIRFLREQKQMSQQELAEKVGYKTASAVNKIELGLRDLNQKKIALFASALGVTPAYLMDGVDITVSNIVPLSKIRRIPLIGKIACGAPILATQNVEEMLLLPDNVKADFALTCKGDSMIDARIHDGDIVFVLSQEEVGNGEIAAVRIGDEATLKRFYRKGDTVILQPENKNYEPLIFSRDEINNSDIEIIGKATYFLSKINH